MEKKPVFILFDNYIGEATKINYITIENVTDNAAYDFNVLEVHAFSKEGTRLGGHVDKIHQNYMAPRCKIQVNIEQNKEGNHIPSYFELYFRYMDLYSNYYNDKITINLDNL